MISEAVAPFLGSSAYANLSSSPFDRKKRAFLVVLLIDFFPFKRACYLEKFLVSMHAPP